MTMDMNKVLVIYKFSKLRYDKKKYNINLKQLIKKYKKENISYKIILKSHYEQEACIQLLRNLLPQAQFIPTSNLHKEITNNKDLIISIGGDEHFKYVIHNSQKESFFLNIRSDNLKSEGSLSTCNRYNLKQMVSQIKNNTYLIEYWTSLNPILNGKTLERSIDTIYVGSKESTRISRYYLIYQGKKEEQKSSGILISTGAGSTGWFLSAGGKNSFSRSQPIAQFLIREIYIGTKTDNSLITGMINHNHSLIIYSLMDNHGLLNIDSIKNYSFTRGDQLAITIFPKSLKIMILNQNIF